MMWIIAAIIIIIILKQLPFLLWNSQASILHLSVNCFYTHNQQIILEILLVFTELFIFPYIHFSQMTD